MVYSIRLQSAGLTMKAICVYLGAKPGKDPQFGKAAIALGQVIAQAGHRLIYGGSSQGLMGMLANAALAKGGLVTGIIPQKLIPLEKPLNTLDKLIVTDSMQERKQLMQIQADAFVVMPGGIGTLEEAFETWSAIKIGYINKPIGFLNIDNFFDDLFSFISHCVKSDFISQSHAHIPKVSADPYDLVNTLLPLEKVV